MDEDMDMNGGLQSAFEYEPQQVPPQVLDENRKMLYVSLSFRIRLPSHYIPNIEPLSPSRRLFVLQ